MPYPHLLSIVSVLPPAVLHDLLGPDVLCGAVWAVVDPVLGVALERQVVPQRDVHAVVRHAVELALEQKAGMVRIARSAAKMLTLGG